MSSSADYIFLFWLHYYLTANLSTSMYMEWKTKLLILMRSQAPIFLSGHPLSMTTGNTSQLSPGLKLTRYTPSPSAWYYTQPERPGQAYAHRMGTNRNQYIQEKSRSFMKPGKGRSRGQDLCATGMGTRKKFVLLSLSAE